MIESLRNDNMVWIERERVEDGWEYHVIVKPPVAFFQFSLVVRDGEAVGLDEVIERAVDNYAKATLARIKGGAR